MNRLRFDFSASKIPPTSSGLAVNFLPLTSCPPLHLAILLAKDSPGEFECHGDLKLRGGNDVRMAKKKLRMAAYEITSPVKLVGFLISRRCFRLEEEWVADSLSSRDDGVMRSVAKVHILRTQKTVGGNNSWLYIQRREASRDVRGIWDIASEAVEDYFGEIAPVTKRHVAVLILDAKGDLRFGDLMNRSAFSNGMGLCGSRSLYALPSCLEEVVSAFSDCSRPGDAIENSDSSESGSSWEIATSVMKNMVEAFISPQPPTQPRDLQHINRTFLMKEPYSFRTKSPGLRFCVPKNESNWPRVDCLRFRYHPCFRIPTDPVPPALPDNPQVYAVESGIVAGAQSGIVLVEIYTDGVYRGHREFTNKPEREVLLLEHDLRWSLPDGHRTVPLKLKIYSAGQGKTVVEDFSTVKSSKVQLPNGYGVAFRSSSLGGPKAEGSRPQQLILHTVTPGRVLTSIRVFHNSALGGLEFMYEDSSTQLFGRRGSSESQEKVEVSDFPLDTRKGESLLGFCVRSGAQVEGIEILTSFGRRSPMFGNPHGGGASNTLIPPRGRSIAGVSGSYAQCVDGFSILYK
ncbi:unnamed protein product [Tuber melanosporum]|uniref:(Perigord truffle) hypothetical protein n=1 Tax=Tuber melanosporum (strain Mel28) TaxID=656061 RepID=D5GDR1_TUBMM|nr:uncharacterized protein GSTUM_00006232001 [Tuber melanosporum]CAZ82654.1 unnamed protein product [Tuber melanosporum]